MKIKKLIFSILLLLTGFCRSAPVEPTKKLLTREQAFTISKGLGAVLITTGSAFFACMSTAKMLECFQENKRSFSDLFPRASLALACAYTARQWAPYTKQILLKQPVAYQDKRFYQDKQKAVAYGALLSALLTGSIAAHMQDSPKLVRYVNKHDKLGATALVLPVFCTGYALCDLVPSIYNNIKPVAQYVKNKYWPALENTK